MDIAPLLEDNFNAIDWINGNYKKYVAEQEKLPASERPAPAAANDDDTNALEFISQSVLKLHLYMQQVHCAVEESSQKLVYDMPRIIKEAVILQAEVEELKKRMQAMRKEMTNVQEETGDCMAALERLNTMQSKLQKAKESLQESDGWGNLISELEDCFEHNDLKGAFDKLLSLQKSLQVQEQLVGHADRLEQVEGFKNRLEAVASPNVVQCFSEGGIEQAKQYVCIFAGIQRASQLEQYYRAVQKNFLQQKWKQILDMPATENSAQKFLSLFYNHLLEHCKQQVKWCAQVFNTPDGNFQPIIVVTELLPTLQPTRESYIVQLLKTCNERLELLQEYALANHNFIAQLDVYLKQSKTELPHEMHANIVQSVYGYFQKFIEQYPRIEETQLSTQVDKLLISQQTAADSVHHMENCNQKVFDWLAEACERCKNITDDLALCRLIDIISGILKKMLEIFSKTQRQIALSIGQGTENWAALQCAMSLLQCLADFQIKLHKFEKALQKRMSTLKGMLHASTNSTTIISIYTEQEQNNLRKSIDKYQRRESVETDSSAAYASSLFFTSIYEQIKLHCIDTHDIALNVLLQPVEGHLANIQPTMNSAADSLMPENMPDFSFVPQECITQIGQYLLTLPQHLEPLLFTPSALLKQALEICNIKYTQSSIPCADTLLSVVVEQCCLLYQSQILQIKNLPHTSAKQFAVDIEYLSNVVEELGLSISTNLSQILCLLKADPENYLALSVGCEPRLVTAIRQMRNIVSTQ